MSQRILIWLVSFGVLFIGWKLFLCFAVSAAISVGCVCFGRWSLSILFALASLLFFLEAAFVFIWIWSLHKTGEQWSDQKRSDAVDKSGWVAGGFLGGCVGTFAGLFVAIMMLLSGSGPVVSVLAMLGVVVAFAALLASIPDVGAEVLGQILNTLS